jgi:hypothetical protein
LDPPILRSPSKATLPWSPAVEWEELTASISGVQKDHMRGLFFGVHVSAISVVHYILCCTYYPGVYRLAAACCRAKARMKPITFLSYEAKQKL